MTRVRIYLVGGPWPPDLSFEAVRGTRAEAAQAAAEVEKSLRAIGLRTERVISPVRKVRVVP